MRRVGFDVVVCGADAASIVVLVTRLEGIVVELELWWHELELLHLANVAFKDLQALLRVEIPKSDGQIIGCREECARCYIKLDAVDPVGVSSKEESLLGLGILDTDGLVHGACRDVAATKVQCDNTLRVSIEHSLALASLPIPKPDRAVKTSSHQLLIVKL